MKGLVNNFEENFLPHRPFQKLTELLLKRKQEIWSQSEITNRQCFLSQLW